MMARNNEFNTSMVTAWLHTISSSHVIGGCGPFSFMSVSGKLVGWRFPSYRMTDMFGPPPGGQWEGA